MRTLLGIDLGTSSVKAVLTSLDGTVVAQATAAYDVDRPRQGWAQTPAEDWWAAIVTAVRTACSQQPGEVSGIGLSGQMHGLVLTAADGGALGPALLWADARATAEVERFGALDAGLLARLANPLFPGMAGPMLLWLQRHSPELYERARWALQPKDWVRLRLTGETASEGSDASATLLYDLVADDWSAEVMASLGLDPDLLAPCLPSAGSLAGRLTVAAAEALGLPAGIPVAAGGGDTAVAALGSGVVDEGVAQFTLGTGMQLVVASRTAPGPVTDPVTHTYRATLEHSWYRMAAVLNGGLTLSWVIGVLGAGWADLYRTAARPPAVDDPVFLPQLNGERTPYLDAGLRGAWFGLSASHDRDSLLRAALEGVAFAARTAMEALPGGRDVGLWRIAGGGTTDPAWRQLLADILGVRLQPVEVPAASGRGAAMLGGIAAGLVPAAEATILLQPAGGGPVIEPDPATAAGHEERRARYAAAIAALREV